MVASALLAVCLAPSLGWAQGRALTREEARREAVMNNLDLLLARKDRERAELIARTSRRPYVPIVRASVNWQDETSLVVAGERNRSFRYAAGASWALPVGTQFDAQVGSTEFLSGASFVPVPTTALELSVVQPLLQGFGSDSNLLDQADLEVQVQRSLFIEQLNAFIVQVDQAYWELAYAQADLDIKTRSVARARQQFEDTSANIERGLLAAGEIYVVEDNLVNFEIQLIRSKESLDLARARLARLMRSDPREEIVAGDSLEAQAMKGGEVAWERDLDAALSNNPRVELQRVSLDQAREQVAFDRNQIKPSLDASAGVTLNGVDQSRAAAWGDVATAQNPDYRVGLRFEVPIDRDPQRARVERAEISVTRAETALAQSENEVTYDLRELVVQLEKRQQILEASGRLVELAELKLSTEQEKYRSGLSTLAYVVQFQREFDSARIARQRAAFDVIVLRARIANTMGVLYREAGLEVR